MCTLKQLTLIWLCVGLATLSATAATITTYDEAPNVSAADIAQLIAPNSDAENIDGAGVTSSATNDASTYVAADRTTQGQLFTTGLNTTGYTLNGFWVQHVLYGEYIDNGTWASLPEDAVVTVRIVDPALTDSDGFVLSSEEATVTSGSDISGGGTWEGTGSWLYFELETPVELEPDKQYGFDMTSTSPYFELAGMDTDLYDGGSAYTTAAQGDLNTGTVHTGDRTFVIPFNVPGLATNLSPANKATDIDPKTSLTWTPSDIAVSQNVYFGENRDDVASATPSNPLGVLVSSGELTSEYIPEEVLTLGQTYYWRVDAVDSSNNTYSGPVMEFTAEPVFFYPTPIAVTASSYDVTDDYNCPPENTINGSGLNNNQHSNLASTMWRTVDGEIEGAWIQYEFDHLYQFNQMHVWNYNGENEAFLGVGAKDTVIKTSLDGETWTTLAELQLSRATGTNTYQGEDIDMNDVVAQYIRIEIQSQHSFGGTNIIVNKTGLSEVQFEIVPIAARRPSPANGTTVDLINGELSWRMGRGAQENRLYMSTDANLVVDANDSVLIDTLSESRYPVANTGAQYAETYYWQIVEVADDQVTPGPVWNFNTPDYLVIDDMESYDMSNLIYETWLDGYDVDENGSEIGDGEPYVEQEIAFGGSQSMPMYYDTTDGEEAAWVELAVDSEIFNTGGVTQFSVMFKSDRTNDGGDFYVEINGTRVYSPASLTTGLWTQLIVDLSEFGNLNSADSLTLGVDGQNLEGIVYIDDVCLYVEAPSLANPTSEQPSDDALEVYYAMENNLEDSAGNRDGQSGAGTTLFYEGSLNEGIMDLGNALSLDGNADSYVDVNDVMSDLVPSLTDSTYAAWVNLTDDSDQGWTRVIDFGTGTDNYMFLTPRSSTDGSPEFGILSPDSVSALEQDVAGPAALTSGWHHLAVTIEQGDPNGTLTLYIDGVAVATDITDTLPSDLGATTNNWLGRSQFASDGYFDGLLDEVRIYSIALTEAEIRWLAGDQ